MSFALDPHPWLRVLPALLALALWGCVVTLVSILVVRRGRERPAPSVPVADPTTAPAYLDLPDLGRFVGTARDRYETYEASHRTDAPRVATDVEPLAAIVLYEVGLRGDRVIRWIREARDRGTSRREREARASYEKDLVELGERLRALEVPVWWVDAAE